MPESSDLRTYILSIANRQRENHSLSERDTSFVAEALQSMYEEIQEDPTDMRSLNLDEMIMNSSDLNFVDSAVRDWSTHDINSAPSDTTGYVAPLVQVIRGYIFYCTVISFEIARLSTVNKINTLIMALALRCQNHMLDIDEQNMDNCGMQAVEKARANKRAPDLQHRAGLTYLNPASVRDYILAEINAKMPVTRNAAIFLAGALESTMNLDFVRTEFFRTELPHPLWLENMIVKCAVEISELFPSPVDFCNACERYLNRRTLDKNHFVFALEILKVHQPSDILTAAIERGHRKWLALASDRML